MIGTTTFDHVPERHSPIPSPWAAKPWSPVMAPMRFLLLYVMTFGFYGFVSMWRWAQDIRSHVDPNTRPVIYVLAYALCPPAAIYPVSASIRRLAARCDYTVWPGPGILTLYSAAVALTGLPFMGVDMDTDEAARALLSELLPIVGLLVCLSSVPMLVLQIQWNQLKQRSARTEPARTSRSLGIRSWSAIVLGSMLWGLVAFTSFATGRLLFAPEPLAAGVAVTDASGRYGLTPGDDGWYLGDPRYDYDQHTVLSLRRADKQVRASLRIVDASNTDLDKLVAERQRSLRKKYGTVAAQEDRVLYGATLNPLSVTRYEYSERGKRRALWVATLVNDCQAAEAMAMVTPQSDAEPAARAIVASLGVHEEDKSTCPSS